MPGQIGYEVAAAAANHPDHAAAASRIERLMIAQRHPMASEFLAHLEFFQSLPDASHDATRFVSYLDADNCIELGRPMLGMAGLPCPADPREAPAPDAQAEGRVLSAAACHWRDWAPELVLGFWIVRSTDRRMARLVEGVSTRIQSIRLKDRYVARLYRPTAAEFDELLEIAALCQTDGMLTGGASPDAALTPEPLAVRARDLDCWSGRRDAWV